ncbi:MAG: DUF4214 domain-containing protein [Actinomycetota bacterium]
MTRHLIHPRSRPRPRIDRRLLALAAAATLVVLGLAAAPVAAQGQPNETGDRPLAAFSGTANSANARFIVDGYQQLLGRSADAAGVDFHLDRLAAGGDRTRLAFTYALLFSTEGAGQEVGRAYGDLLGRGADAEGSGYWTTHLQGNDVLDLRVLLLSSDEYRDRAGGTDGAWIGALYLDILGRTADGAGLAYWQGLAATTPRPLIVAGIYLSDEALGRRVDAYHLEALGRAPTAAERSLGITTIRAVGEREYRATVWASDEVFESYLDAALS